MEKQEQNGLEKRWDRVKGRYRLRIYDRPRATNKIITFKGDSKHESWG